MQPPLDRRENRHPRPFHDGETFLQLQKLPAQPFAPARILQPGVLPRQFAEQCEIDAGREMWAGRCNDDRPHRRIRADRPEDRLQLVPEGARHGIALFRPVQGDRRDVIGDGIVEGGIGGHGGIPGTVLRRSVAGPGDHTGCRPGCSPLIRLGYRRLQAGSLPRLRQPFHRPPNAAEREDVKTGDFRQRVLAPPRRPGRRSGRPASQSGGSASRCRRPGASGRGWRRRCRRFWHSAAGSPDRPVGDAEAHRQANAQAAQFCAQSTTVAPSKTNWVTKSKSASLLPA